MPIKDKAYHTERRRRRVAEGLCANCSLPQAPGKSLCEKHLVINRERLRKKYQESPAYRKANYEYTRKWAAANPERWRELINASAKRKRDEIRATILDAYGRKCACCNEPEKAFLAIEHVHGGGNLERKNFGTYKMYKRIIDLGFPKDYQLLCHNCNMAKHLLGECPHETTRKFNGDKKS